MNISILTSRYGPNDRQIDRFEELLSNQFSTYRHEIIINHGGDRGDEIIHDKCLIQKFTVEVHPAFKADEEYGDFPSCKIHERRRLEDRNRNLIVIAQVVIAMPQYMNGWEDSPIWKTIRAGIKGEKELYIISPEGYCYKFWR